MRTKRILLWLPLILLALLAACRIAPAEEKLVPRPTGFDGALLYINVDGGTRVYRRAEAGTGGLTRDALLDSFTTATHIEGIVWEVYSAVEYPDLFCVLVISGTNSAWTYQIADDGPR